MSQLPPPINPQRPPGTPQRRPERDKRIRKGPDNSSKTWRMTFLSLGGALLVTGLIVAFVFLTSRKDAIRSPKGEERTHSDNISMEENEGPELQFQPVLEEAKSPSAFPLGNPWDYYVFGHLDNLPITMDLSVDNNSNVTGTFWNMLFDIKLPVQGTVYPDGRVELHLGSSSNTHSVMRLTSKEGSEILKGGWGKDSKPVELTAVPGNRDTNLAASSGTRFSIKGGGMTTYGHFSPDGKYITFDNQPALNRLPVSNVGNVTNILDPFNGKVIASYYNGANDALEPYSTELAVIGRSEPFMITLNY